VGDERFIRYVPDDGRAAPTYVMLDFGRTDGSRSGWSSWAAEGSGCGPIPGGASPLEGDPESNRGGFLDLRTGEVIPAFLIAEGDGWRGPGR
jgi:hypothetical protein